MVNKFRIFIPYLSLISILSITSVFLGIALLNQDQITHNLYFQVIILGTILLIGYYINRIGPKTSIPSYIWTILAGMALQPMIGLMTRDILDLNVVMEICAAIILFTVGLEVPFRNFKKWFLPVASLSLLGVILSSMVFALVMFSILLIFGIFDISIIPSIIILGAALASADPAIILPSLKKIYLKQKRIRQFDIAESSLTDVTGSIFTRFLLLALVSFPLINTSLTSSMIPRLLEHTYYAMSLQLIVGLLVGFASFMILKNNYRTYAHEKNNSALLLGIPVFTLAVGNILGGAGLLAAFISGLLTDLFGDAKKISHYYDTVLDHFIKPFVFIILGTLVPVTTLVTLAPFGIVVALIFMFIIRPFVTFVSLIPWVVEHKLTLKDVLFLSFTRETGVITAILIITAASFNIIASDLVIVIGIWVMMVTLVAEPTLIPYLAKRLQIEK